MSESDEKRSEEQRRLEQERLELERRRIQLEERRFEHERATSSVRQSFLNRNLGTVISLATILISGVQVWTTVVSRDKELELAQLQRQREMDNGWRKDFFEYLKENDEAIFGEDPKKRVLKRNVLVAAFPEDLVGHIRTALADSAGSAGELSLVAAPLAGTARGATTGASRSDSLRPLASIYWGEDVGGRDQVWPDAGLKDDARLVDAVTKRLKASLDMRTRVFIHYTEARDKAVAQSLALELEEGGHSVPRLQLLSEGASKSGDVRYFQPEDEPLALDVRDRLRKVLAEKGLSVGGEIRVLKLDGYANVPRRVLEVWIPALGQH